MGNNKSKDWEDVAKDTVENIHEEKNDIHGESGGTDVGLDQRGDLPPAPVPDPDDMSIDQDE